MTQPVPPVLPQKNKVYNSVLTTVIAQVGCFTPVIIIASLYAGLWLDGAFASKPLFTIIFILGSMPVSILVLLAIVRSATKRLKSENKTPSEIPSKGGP